MILSSLIRQTIVGITATAVTVSLAVGAHAAMHTSASAPVAAPKVTTAPSTAPVQHQSSALKEHVSPTTVVVTTVAPTTVSAPAVVPAPTPTTAPAPAPANANASVPFSVQLHQAPSTPSLPNNVKPPKSVTTTTSTPPLVLRKNPNFDGPTPDEMSDDFMDIYENGYGADQLAGYTTPDALKEALAIDFNLALGATRPNDCAVTTATTVCIYVADNSNSKGAFTVTVDNPSELVTSFVYRPGL
jgi:hypothetical protein